MSINNSSHYRMFNGSGEEFRKLILLDIFTKFNNIHLLMKMFKINRSIFIKLKKILKKIHL